MKSKTVTLLLCFFFGYLGIHRFYLNQTALGVIYLLTGGLFGIGWIVDFIGFAIMPTERFNAKYNMWHVLEKFIPKK